MKLTSAEWLSARGRTVQLAYSGARGEWCPITRVGHHYMIDNFFAFGRAAPYPKLGAHV